MELVEGDSLLPSTVGFMVFWWAEEKGGAIVHYTRLLSLVNNFFGALVVFMNHMAEFLNLDTFF
jgi:hypothetical protein